MTETEAKTIKEIINIRTRLKIIKMINILQKRDESDISQSGSEESVEVKIDEKISLAGLVNPNLMTPEEIRKWVMARKKNYPTKTKVLEK